jgi:hypothetical protein
MGKGIKRKKAKTDEEGENQYTPSYLSEVCHFFRPEIFPLHPAKKLLH